MRFLSRLLSNLQSLLSRPKPPGWKRYRRLISRRDGPAIYGVWDCTNMCANLYWHLTRDNNRRDVDILMVPSPNDKWDHAIIRVGDWYLDPLRKQIGRPKHFGKTWGRVLRVVPESELNDPRYWSDWNPTPPYQRTDADED